MAKEQSLFKRILVKLGLAFEEGKIPEAIHKESGVPLRFSIDEETFPDQWLNKDIKPKVELLPKNEVSRSTFIIFKAMDKYPVDFLKKNLTAVYVFGKMTFHGFLYAGTHDESKIYMVNAGPILGFKDNFIETTFHHEFSSILFSNYPDFFRKKEWYSINKKAYLSLNPQDVLKDDTKSSKDFDPALCEMGFLNSFAISNFRNDFVTIAENVMLGDSRFFEVVKHHPRIKKKCDLMVQFFYMLDDRFTPDFFKKIRGLT